MNSKPAQHFDIETTFFSRPLNKWNNVIFGALIVRLLLESRLYIIFLVSLLVLITSFLTACNLSKFIYYVQKLRNNNNFDFLIEFK